MRAMQNEEPGFKGVPAKDIFDWSVFLTRSHAEGLMNFLRSKRGSRKPGIIGLIAWVAIIPAYAAYWQSDAMLMFWWVWIAVTIYRRTETMVVNHWRRRKRQRRIHSLYDGSPWLTEIMVFYVKDERILLAMEPLMCLLIGVTILPFSLPLGYFVMAGFFSLGSLEFLYRHIENIRDGIRDDDMSDLEWETARYWGR
jgi:hypothetical protein